MRTNVYLTVDLECRRNSTNCDGPIWGRIAGRQRPYGLDFILQTLKHHNLRATFFVEPFFSHKFGMDALKRICETIMDNGQDIQLHLHPYFKSTANHILNDNMHSYTLPEQVALIQEGLHILSECGLNNVVAFRAGSFGANNETYDALRTCNLRISSNYNLDYLQKNCMISLENEHNDFFSYRNILEAPVTCFSEIDMLKMKRSFRHMQVTAASNSEMRYVIQKAPKHNVKNIVILFHSHEFVRYKDEAKLVGQPCFTDIKRLTGLCRFLAASSKVDVKTFSDIESDEFEVDKNLKVVPQMPFLLTVSGRLGQFWKRLAY